MREFDPYEGLLPEWMASQLVKAENWKADAPGVSQELLDAAIAFAADNVVAQMEADIERGVFVNCWHMSSYESDAMWRLYSLRGQGIAIKSTVGDLMDAVTDLPSLTIRQVTYEDYERYVPDTKDDLSLAFAKSHSFAHERELRIAYRSPTEQIMFDQDAYDLKHAMPPSGHPVSVDLTKLLRAILISPDAASWVVDTIRRLVLRYGFSATLVAQSGLYQLRPTQPKRLVRNIV